MKFYTDYIRMLDDALAVGDIDFPVYSILRDAAFKLHMLKNGHVQPLLGHVTRRRQN